MARSESRPRISFEFFPPKTPKSAGQLWASVERLAPLAPRFVSVTYGAGGSTRDRTMSAILAIREHARLEVAGHLTCVSATKDEVIRVAKGYQKLGCRRIVALRGDPPCGADRFTAHPGGFEGAADLVDALARLGQFEIFVAAYPEKHPEAASMSADIDHLKRKIDAGAAGAITQFFFDNEVFYRFRDACAAAGITVPIIPGILPVDDFEKMVNFAARCQTSVPDWMHTAYRNAETMEDHDLLSVAIATEQCDELLEAGVEHLHLYTLNKPDLPWQVCRALGIEPQAIKVAAAGCG
ncbi:MAG: methylenetetrahydrofolate reductase [NAD(P)H] [Pseudomonadota bacterium]